MGRFANLVNTLEGIENFKAHYHIPVGVSIRYRRQGEWHAMRLEGEMVIPMIALCKVEFSQPSCWLYSVPNFLVI